MGCFRESFNIWTCLYKRYPYGGWQIKRLFKKRFWTNRYVWHDSFGKYFNRFFRCAIFGHGKVQDISDPGKEMHCFNCEKSLKQ
jgi:hypothetical protein